MGIVPKAVFPWTAKLGKFYIFMKGLEQQRVQHKVDTKVDGGQALQVIEVTKVRKDKITIP